MWSSVTVIISIILGAIALKKEKTLLNPVSVLSFLWGIIVFLSKFQLYSLMPTSESVYPIILLGILSFYLGYILRISHIGRNKYIGKAGDKWRRQEINRKLLYSVSVVCIFYYVYFGYKGIKLLFMGNDLAFIREIAQTETNESGIQNLIRNYMVGPFTYTIMMVAGVNFWKGGRDKVLQIISFLLMILSMIGSGGRISIFYYGVPFTISFMSSDSFVALKTKLLKNRKEKKRSRRLFYNVGMLGILVLLIATYSRRGADNIKAVIYYYFSMEPKMLENWIHLIPYNVFGYGMASLNGYFFAFFYLVKNILAVNYPDLFYSIFDLIQKTESNWQTVSNGGRFANAYVSAFWYMYLDGRYIGVIIGMIIYGFVSAELFFKSKILNNEKAIAIYSMMLYGILFSFIRMQFASIYYALGFLYLSLFAYGTIQKHNKPHITIINKRTADVMDELK